MTETLRDKSDFAGGLEKEDEVGEGRLFSTGRGPFAFSGTNGGSMRSISNGATAGGLLIGLAGSGSRVRRSGSTQEGCQDITNSSDMTPYQSKT